MTGEEAVGAWMNGRIVDRDEEAFECRDNRNG
jgi:hypothetical protein